MPPMVKKKNRNKKNFKINRARARIRLSYRQPDSEKQAHTRRKNVQSCTRAIEKGKR